MCRDSEVRRVLQARLSDAPAPDALPYNRISRPLDRLLVAIGRASAWLWLAVLLVVLANVFSRFALSRGSIALEELSGTCSAPP